MTKYSLYIISFLFGTILNSIDAKVEGGSSTPTQNKIEEKKEKNPPQVKIEGGSTTSPQNKIEKFEDKKEDSAKK